VARRAILITGGARGLGRAIADSLAPDHDIAITWNTAAEEAAVFASAHPRALVLQADLETAPPAQIIAAVIARFGRLDGLVNNAAMGAREPGPEAFDQGLAKRVFAVNVTAPLALVGAALPHLGAGASVVNISSANARFPAMAAPVFSASKAALENLTLGLAKALGPRGIRVNAVAPGAVERPYAPGPPEAIRQFTDRTALGRPAQAAEVAQAVRFLLSDAASAITGTVLDASGGDRL